MKYHCKVKTPTGDVREEAMTAGSREDLNKVLGMVGYELLEVLREEAPVSLVEGLSPDQKAKLAAAGSSVPNMGGGVSGVMPSQQLPPKPPQYKEYTDNGIQYRVELNTGVLQKKSWVKMSKDDMKYIAVEDKGNLVTAHAKKLTLYRLEWKELG